MRARGLALGGAACAGKLPYGRWRVWSGDGSLEGQAAGRRRGKLSAMGKGSEHEAPVSTSAKLPEGVVGGDPVRYSYGTMHQLLLR